MLPTRFPLNSSNNIFMSADDAPTRFRDRVQQLGPLNDEAVAFLTPKATEFGFTLVHEKDREAVVTRAWESGGRQGALKTYQRLVEGKVLGISRTFVEDWARHNETLQVTSAGKQVISNPTRVSACWELAAADLFFMPAAKGGFVGALVLVDAFSGYVLAEPLRDKRAATVARAFQRFFSAGFIPKTLRVDAGPEFQGECMELLLKYRVQLRISTSSHGNTASAERANHTLKTLLTRAKVAAGTPWPEALQQACLGHNTSKGPRGFSPHHILFRRCEGLVAQMDAATPPEPEILGVDESGFEPEDDPYDDHLGVEAVTEAVEAAMDKSASRMITRSTAKLAPIAVGDLVRVRLTALDAAARRKAEGAFGKTSTQVHWTSSTHKVTGIEEGRVPGMEVYRVEGYSGGFPRSALLIV
jgi:hypothetical protein